MQKVLPSIISKEHNGYLKKRFIGINIRTIYDIINHVENSSGALAFLDFDKVFDKITWKFYGRGSQFHLITPS